MLNLRPRSEHKAELDLTPFMDVIFILLIFFIIASAFAVRGLDIDLPSAHSSQALSGRVVEVRLNDDGSFLCEGVPVERSFLRYKLQDIVRGFKKEPGQLVLKASPNAPVEALIFVVDEVRMLGGEKLMVATSRPEEKQ
ncbi:MAG: biopolymer transporter ExbD [Mailhella sp.]|nr:biopolymer transporter ExbD [Mailhella sp.]MBQ9105106.1 biopolymer transporter ExbD [Mailhella sp.]